MFHGRQNQAEIQFDRKIRIVHTPPTLKLWAIMTPNAILNLDRTSEMAPQPRYRAADNRSTRQPVAGRPGPRRQSGRQFRLCRLLDRDLLPPILPVAAPAQGERYVLPQTGGRREGRLPCLPALPSSEAIGGNKQAEMVKAVCRYIERHLDEPITLNAWEPNFATAHFICSVRSKRCSESRRAHTQTPAA